MAARARTSICPIWCRSFRLAPARSSIGTTGGTFSYTLSVANMPPHTHYIEQTPHSHSAYQNAHSHGIATGGHSHGVSDPGHAHSVPGVLVGGGAGLGFGSNYSQTGTAGTTASGTGISIQAVGNLGGNTDAQQPGVGVNANYANINNNATDSVGSGAAISIVPPFIALNFIIRFQ